MPDSIVRRTAVERPGIYDAIAAADYHTPGLTPQPALSSSGARALLSTCPARFYHDYVKPRPPVHKRCFDIGQAAHLLVLEPHLFRQSVSVIRGKTKEGKESKGYTSQDAKDHRDYAYDQGLVPLLPDEYDAIIAMREALFADPVAKAAFDPAHVVTEQTRVWVDDETKVWCKARLDGAAVTSNWFSDYKTCLSAKTDDVAKSIVNYGYHIQAAWYLDSVAATGGPSIDRFAFVFQEKSAPYLTAVFWLDPEWIAEGRKAGTAARQKFAECMSTGKWPGYQSKTESEAGGAHTVTMPGWFRRQIEDREASGASFFDPKFASTFQGFAPLDQESAA